MFLGFLHNFVMAKLATSSIRVKIIFNSKVMVLSIIDPEECSCKCSAIVEYTFCPKPVMRKADNGGGGDPVLTL